MKKIMIILIPLIVIACTTNNDNYITTQEFDEYKSSQERMQTDLKKIKCLTILWNIEIMFPHSVTDNVAPVFHMEVRAPYIREQAKWYVSNCIPSMSSSDIEKINLDIDDLNTLYIATYLSIIYKENEEWNSNYPIFWNDYN